MACLTRNYGGRLVLRRPTVTKRLPDGKYPMTFTAAVDGLTVTRTTTENSWEGGEEVAVQIGNTVKKYIVSADKKTLSSSDPFYWEKSDESKNVTAWHYGTVPLLPVG